MAKSRRGPKSRASLPAGSRDNGAQAAGAMRWSLQRAAMNGALCDSLVGLARLLIFPEPGYPAAYYIGAILGWAVLGSMLGIIIAVVTNAARR